MAKIMAHFSDEGAGDQILRGAARLREEMRQLKQDVAADAELIFAAHALKGSTGKLSRGITSKVVGDAVHVEAHAKSRAGYDYVGVTRFGHRNAWIVPRHPAKAKRFYPKTARAFPINGKFFSSIRGFAALSTPFGYRRRVRGFKPSSDWAADALPEIQAEAQRQLDKFGRGFTARLS